MDLAQQRPARRGARVDSEDDQEHIALVLLDLGPLLERARVLDGEGVQVDQRGQFGDLVGARALVVQPHELLILDVRDDLVVLGIVEARNPQPGRPSGVRLA